MLRTITSCHIQETGKPRGSYTASPKQLPTTGEPIYLRMFHRHFPISGLVLIVFAR